MTAGMTKSHGKRGWSFKKVGHFGGEYYWVKERCKGMVVARMWWRGERKRLQFCKSLYSTLMNKVGFDHRATKLIKLDGVENCTLFFFV